MAILDFGLGPAGSSGQLQFNNAGQFGASSNLVWNGADLLVNGVPVGAGGGAPTTGTYITQTPNASLSAEQALSLLGTGLLKNTTTTGILSIAVAADIPDLSATYLTLAAAAAAYQPIGSYLTGPAGSTTQVQFNDAGVFAGDSALVWNKTSNILTLDGTLRLTDTDLIRGDAAGQITLSAGSSVTSFRIKNGSAAELGAMYWNGSNQLIVGTQGGVGAGAARDTILSSALDLILAAGGTSRWTVDDTLGHLRPFADATYDLGGTSLHVRAAYVDKLGLLTTNGLVTTSAGDGTLGITALGTGVGTFLATPSSANLLAAVTNETGTGALVFADTPTLIAPLLGTPTSGTLTNCTLPIGGVTGLGSNVATFLATPSSANLAAALTDETGTGANVFATAPALTGPIVLTEAVGSSGLTITGATQVTSFPALSLTQTWNAAGVAFKGLFANITTTAFANDSYLIDLQASTVSQFKVTSKSATIGSAAVWETAASTLGIIAGSSIILRNTTHVLGTSTSASTVTIDSSGVRLKSNAVLEFTNSTTNSNTTLDTFLGRGGAAATVQLGVDVNGAATAQILQSCAAITGTDVAGSNFTIQSGTGTGSAAVSSLFFKTPTATTTGTTTQALGTRLTLSETFVTCGVPLKVSNAAVTGLVAGVLAASTNASIVICDSAGVAYRIPCVV